MSTAGRPTYYSAVGKSTYGGARSCQVCVRDQTTNTKLKVRQFGQNTVEELRNRDFREEIESREEAHTKERNRTLALITEEERKVDVPLLLMNKPEIDPVVLQKYDDADAEVDYEENDDGFDSSSEEEEDDDEDDEEEQLQAELQRIREERAAAQAKKAQEEEEEAERLNRDSAIRGNPLMNTSGFDDSAKVCISF